MTHGAGLCTRSVNRTDVIENETMDMRELRTAVGLEKPT